MEHKIVFEPFGTVTYIDENENILRAAQRVGLKLEAYCNGQQICGKCKIKISDGDFPGYGGIHSSMKNVTEMTNHERQLLTLAEVKEGYRLACMTKVCEDVVVEIPRESRTGQQVILEKGKERKIECKPSVKAYTISIEKPTLEDHEDDFTRVKKAFLQKYKELSQELSMDYEVLRNLPVALREGNWKITALILHGKKVIKVVPAEMKIHSYGVAVDVGTTTVALYLCDLQTGEQLQTASLMNPQIKYGDDVLTRISYCVSREDGVDELQGILMEELNRAIAEMAEKEKIEKHDIVECVLVFNTVMEHIALKIPPNYIGQAPFVSVITKPMDLPAKELGIDILPNGNVHCLPVEAGFIGADNVAVLIAEEPYKQDKMKLIIDIGTNSEICLGNQEKLYVTSCATGPALEGAQIYCGMRAVSGAIEKVVIDPNTLEPTIRTIQNVPRAIGICGSGIIDAVAQMAFTGIIDSDGKFSKNAVSPRIRTDQTGKKEYVLYFKKSPGERDIVVKQKDVRAVQLAKAALYAGAKELMKRCNVNKVDEVILAGGFGSYIDKENALALGMFPDCNLNKVTVSGNAAGMGAKMALINVDKRKEAEVVARQVEFVETATDAQFQTMFAQAMSIPPEKDNFSANLTGKWSCQGQDGRILPDEVIGLGESVMTNLSLLEHAVDIMRRKDRTDVKFLPIMQNIEAVSLGAHPQCISNVYAIKDYKFHSLDDIQIASGDLRKKPQIQTLLAFIDKHKGERMVLDVEGPFSVLSGLINPTVLFLAGRKQKERLHELLHIVADEMADYVIEAVSRGVQVISLAEPEGAIDLVGKKFYQEFSGATFRYFMKKIEPALKTAVVQICGKTSYALEQTGMVLTKRYRVEEKDYMDILFDLAEDKRTKFVGHACINRKRLGVPIVTKIELIEER